MTTKPRIRGEKQEWRDGRYRLYTVEHLPFDAIPSYRDGGPSKVLAGGWSTSCSVLDRFHSSDGVVAADDGLVTISATRDGHYVGVGTAGVQYVTEKHPLHGTKHATLEAAEQAQYEAGLLAFMVYERDAQKWGL